MESVDKVRDVVNSCGGVLTMAGTIDGERAKKAIKGVKTMPRGGGSWTAEDVARALDVVWVLEALVKDM